MRKLLFVFSLLFSFKSYALIGADTAMMIQLVTNTANQINELEDCFFKIRMTHTLPFT